MLGINIDDVVKVLKSCAPYLIGMAVVLVLALVAIIACMKMSKSKKYLVRTQAGVAMVLAIAIGVNLICFGPMSSMISLATGNGTISEETSAQAQVLCEDIAAEGIVLLQNNDSMLPLSTDTKLNVFGWSSTNPVYGGTGSGSLSDSYPTVSLIEGLQNAGFTLNDTIEKFYTDYRATRPTIGMWGQDWTIPEPTIDEYTQAGIFENAKAFSDVAVVVISRSGGEGADLPTSLPQTEDTYAEGGSFGATGTRYSSNTDDLDPSKHYLELSTREAAMLSEVTANFDNVVVVYNGANPLELGFVEQYKQIKSVLWCPGTGQTGFNALGNILSGAVNPSGKTIDTFLYDLTTAPTWNNYGVNVYDNMDEYAYTSGGFTGIVSTVTPGFVNYVEGIYVGYRFYETAAAEGRINYDAVVQYPFGYGMSYTSFQQSMGKMQVTGDTITVDVTVTNTGSVAGKDIVQLYYNPPYYNGGIEKATANLIAYDKTDSIEPGASQTLTLEISLEDMASYDTYNNGCYTLEAGDYVISINKNAHEIIDSQTYTQASAIVYDENNKRSTDQVAATNEFAHVEGDATYLSRANGFANYAQATAAPTNFSLSDEKKATFLNNSNYNPQDYNNASDVMPTTGAKNGMKLEDLRGASYDDARWDTLLDQMTISDMDTLIAIGGYQTSAAASVGKYGTIDCDGPASINNNFTGVGSIGFPSGVMLASTFNKNLAQQFGESIGKMADEMGVSGWYAPATNIHRSAFSGRNFEYYSEDPYISGVVTATATQGAEKYGVYAYLKHFALNDQETARGDMLCTWSNEQAIREIYLKPFEMGVKDGGAKAIMSSFNYVGTEWAGGSAALLNTVLRDEWGFQGFVLTDYFGNMAYMNADQAIRNGTDCMLVAYDTETNHVVDSTSATGVLAMRNASKNIMYTVVNSRAYAPENIQTGPMGWQVTAIAIDIVIILLLLAIELLGVRKGYRRRKQEELVFVETQEEEPVQ